MLFKIIFFDQSFSNTVKSLKIFFLPSEIKQQKKNLQFLLDVDFPVEHFCPWFRRTRSMTWSAHAASATFWFPFWDHLHIFPARQQKQNKFFSLKFRRLSLWNVRPGLTFWLLFVALCTFCQISSNVSTPSVTFFRHLSISPVSGKKVKNEATKRKKKRMEFINIICCFCE